MSGEIEGIKIKEVYNSDGTTHNSWVIKCPGCGDYHLIDNRWEFNGDIKHPTFRPSLMCSWKYTDERDERTCHSFITNGYILVKLSQNELSLILHFKMIVHILIKMKI